MPASANMSRIGLEPGVSGLALDSTGAKHTTSNAWACELGPVAELKYKRGHAIWKLAQSAAATTGAATLTFKAGSVTLATVNIDLTASQVQTGKVPVSLAGLEGTQGIKATLTVDTVADAGITGSLDAAVDVEVPLVSGC